MIIKKQATERKNIGAMKLNIYNINNNFSAAHIEINGKHGKLKCIGEDRIYFIISGKGKFIIDDKEKEVSENDLVFVPKNTPYNFEGKMTYFLVCSPAFKPEDDVWL